MRTIDADKLLKYIEDHAYMVAYDKYSEDMGMTMPGIRQCIEEMAENKGMKPILNPLAEVDGSDIYNCPSCNKPFSGKGIAKYCFHCGQKIDWR